MPSDPFTAPMVNTAGTIAWGASNEPDVDADRVVRPSPPAHSFKNLPDAAASGEATTTVYVPVGSVTNCMI